METTEILETVERLRTQVRRVVMGQDHVVDLLLVALFSDGHVLLEGVPGTAKTLLARAFAACLALEFKRVQFTPDMMPGDILGTNLFDFQTSRFTLRKGPVFTQMLLADEINRTPPKTQAALLEAMQERAVTIDGATHSLGARYMVVATQNPIEQEGTYPLPEAQLDRFLFKVEVNYPTRDAEREMVRVHGHRSAFLGLERFEIERVASPDFLERASAAVAAVRLSDEIVDYVVDLVRATREHPALVCGASPRAASMLASAARSSAFLAGRDFVVPDDVKKLARATLRHRVVVAPGAEIEGRSSADVVAEVVQRTAAPR
jgi:MoxR-like ATPase